MNAREKYGGTHRKRSNGTLKRLGAAFVTMIALVACIEPNPSPTPTLFILPTWPSPESENMGAVVTPAFPILSTSIPQTPDIVVTFGAGPINPDWEGAAANCILDAEFVTDVTIPDYTEFKPGASFTKTWRVKNTSTCDWSADFAWVSVGGDTMADPGWVFVPPTPKGETVDITVTMNAPSTPGTHWGFWRMQSPDGRQFGAQPYVLITVPGATMPPPAPSVPETSEPGISLPSSVISGVTSHSRQIFLAGQTVGNRRNVFAKVGDSVTYTSSFLNDIGNGRAVWHGYSSLKAAAGYFSTEKVGTGNSFNTYSLAAYPGWTAADLLNPAKADGSCGGSAPMDCEYQNIKPAVAIIMIGTNDATGHTPLDAYQADLNRIVEVSIERGVIPVLTTIPWTSYNDSVQYNNIIIVTARTYDIPLIDYWTVMEKAPNHGVGGDGVHPTIPPDGNAANFSNENLQYGATLRNLVTLKMLDALWRQVLSY